MTPPPRITAVSENPPEAITSIPDNGDDSPSLGNVPGTLDTPASRMGTLTDEIGSMRNEPAPSTVSEELPGVQQDSTPAVPVAACDTGGDAPVPPRMVPADRSSMP